MAVIRVTPFLLWTLDRIATDSLAEAWAEVLVYFANGGMWELEIAWRCGAMRLKAPKIK